MTNEKLICPCCFSRTLGDRGRFEICEVCYWEDDGQDDGDADVVRGGPNGDLSLTKARANYAICRASDPLCSSSLRRPTPSELTEKSPMLITAPAGISEDAVFTLINHKDDSAIATLVISCPPDAPEAWRKRLAVLAACERGETEAYALLSRANLSGADLRDAKISVNPGQIDLFQALLDDADLSFAVLIDARMIGTSLCNANLRGAIMMDAVLHYARFDRAILAGARLIGSRFTYGWLRQTDLRRANANNCDFSECDLSGANMAYGSFEGCCFDEAILTGANIKGANFCGSTFKDAVLKGLDFASASWSGAVIKGAIINSEDFPDVPIVPDIHQAIYAAARAEGALDMGAWHSCETTHWRAGWTVTLAGDAGSALEAQLGTLTAATLIYLVSDPKLDRIPDFHANAEDALADMQRLAEN